jgi:hypothetical protein
MCSLFENDKELLDIDSNYLLFFISKLLGLICLNKDFKNLPILISTNRLVSLLISFINQHLTFSYRL